jgi:uncharacterized integral membrane protein
MRALVWLLRVGLFIALFALALNNQHEVALKTLFGHEWRAPMIFIVLAAFALGCAAGVAGMLPSWWRRRRPGAPPPPADTPPTRPAAATTPAALAPFDHPPRDGL